MAKSKPTDEEVKFQAVVYRVTTLDDGAPRVIYDLPEDAIGQASIMMMCQRDQIVLDVTVRFKRNPE